MAASAVCTDPGAAHVLQSAGVAVVMMGLDSALLGRLAAGLRSNGRSGGRVAVFVGDPGDPADLSAAVAMAEEQFGVAPVMVSSPAQAQYVVAREIAWRHMKHH
jgi:hypothetical protein